MKVLSAIGGGLAGAIAVTLIHEIVRRIEPDAPRMDLLGMDAVSKILKYTDHHVPDDKDLYKITIAGDIISNTVYYGLAVAGKRKIWTRGSLLGLAAGIGAVLLPGVLGLKAKYSNKNSTTQLLTTALYLAGGLVSSAVAKSLNGREKPKLIS